MRKEDRPEVEATLGYKVSSTDPGLQSEFKNKNNNKKTNNNKKCKNVNWSNDVDDYHY